jgi:hypothetical protein
MGRFVIAVCMLLCSNLACFAANKGNCTALTWTSTGIVISNSGVYCLTADIDTGSGFTAGTAISINASDVTLDLGSHTISNLGAGMGSKAIGIAAQGENHVVVRNGTLEGFYRAIDFDRNSDQLITDIRSDSATEFAIYVSGSGAVVRHSYIIRAGGLPAGLSGAISAHGNDLRVLDNDIVDLQTGGPNIIGIDLDECKGGVIEGNRISSKPVPGKFSYFGIFVFCNTPGALVVNNRITGTTKGVSMEMGKYRDNLTAGVKTPYYGHGIDEGNNQ